VSDSVLTLIQVQNLILVLIFFFFWFYVYASTCSLRLTCICLNDVQFTMELAATESGHTPKCYSMDMSKDFIPMSVFSESSQGKLFNLL
jgi:hypothetical protein